jgi:hypothetical protein
MLFWYAKKGEKGAAWMSDTGFSFLHLCINLMNIPLRENRMPFLAVVLIGKFALQAFD